MRDRLIKSLCIIRQALYCGRKSRLSLAFLSGFRAEPLHGDNLYFHSNISDAVASRSARQGHANSLSMAEQYLSQIHRSQCLAEGSGAECMKEKALTRFKEWFSNYEPHM